LNKPRKKGKTLPGIRTTNRIFFRIKQPDGFTFTEVVVCTAVFSLLIGALFNLFSSSYKGYFHGQETIDQTRTAMLLFQWMSIDLRAIVPWPILTEYGRVNAFIDFVPNENGASKVEFWIIEEQKLKRIRYRFDSAKKEIRRETLSKDLKIENTMTFGSGYLEDFRVVNTDKEAREFKVCLIMQGKSRSQTFTTIFSRGFFNAKNAQSWVFDLKQ